MVSINKAPSIYNKILLGVENTSKPNLTYKLHLLGNKSSMAVKKYHWNKKKADQREGQDAGLGSSAILSQ